MDITHRAPSAAGAAKAAEEERRAGETPGTSENAEVPHRAPAKRASFLIIFNLSNHET